MFIPGAKSTFEPAFLSSLPISEQSSSTSRVLNVLASAVPHGNREVYFLILIPAGPSVVITAGTPFLLSSGIIPPKAPALPATP